MMLPKALPGLQVIGVRYRGSRPAQNDERALNAYAASKVYEAGNVPYDVAAYAVGSVYGEGDGSEVSVASGIELIRGGLKAWHRYGMPE